MNSRFIILFLIAPFISFGQITKVKSYSLNSNGIPWRADIEIMQKDSIKEAFLRIQYKDNGIYFKNVSYLSWQEVKEINEGYTEMAIGAINDEKTGESTQNYFKTEDGTYIGY